MQVLSWLIVKLLMHRWIYVAFKETGFFFCEWPLNFLVLNGGIFGLFKKLATFGLIDRFKWPLPEDEEYASCIGHMDPRTKLFLDSSPEGKAKSKQADQVIFPDESVGSRKTADVCVMAAKLAYENPVFVERVVTNVWNMYYVKFFNCWNEYQKMHNTQAFLFTDKKREANAIVLAFRGTEGFNTYDWSTDFDFKWMDLKEAGNVHLGFLEALGLTSRDKKDTMKHMGSHDKSSNPSKSGLGDGVTKNHEKSLAFDDITFKVKKLMKKHPNAKLFITGHSLGGALASLYPVMLHYFNEHVDPERIGAVYTFGQPRVGDQKFSDYASEILKGKYFRYVYCNDMVPRIPFDGRSMKFKHFGTSIYFNSVYDAMILTKEPSPNYIGFGRFLGTRLNALWEMFQAMILITFRHGKEYSESKFSLMSRMMGLFSPGASAHSPTNYVNAVRLGHCPPQLRSDLKNEFHLMMDNVIRIVDTVWDVVKGMAAKVKGLFVEEEE